MKINFMLAFLKAIYAVIVSVFIYHFFYVEYIRENVEDVAFDFINRFYLLDKKQKTNSPKVMLFKVDKFYLQKHNLLNENNETNYGYIFPREQIASFIDKVDNFTKNHKDSCPRVLFIDYDFSYPGSYNNQLSPHDNILLNTLKKKRCYSVLLPKTQTQNFIEQSKDPDIQQAILDNKIVFASVGLTIGGDYITRRYFPYEYYVNENSSEKPYISAAISMWNSSKKFNTNKILQIFNQDEISLIENRIIYKNKYFYEQTNEYETLTSSWDQLSIFSANYPLNNILQENIQDAILLYGSSHKFSNDYFVVDVFNNELSGIEIHTEALMTLFYLDGPLKRLNIYINSILVFIIVFSVDVLLQQIGCHVKWFRKKKTLYVFVSMGIMLVFSIILINEYKVWFNWLIPSLLIMSIPIVFSIIKFTRSVNFQLVFAYLLTVKIISTILNKIIKRKTKCA